MENKKDTQLDAQFDFMMSLQQKATLESVFDVQLISILAEFLPVKDIFLKASILNKNFHNVVKQLSQKFNSLWYKKYLNEFESDGTGIQTDSEELYVQFLGFVCRFPDLDSDGEAFEVLKKSYGIQQKMRKIYLKLVSQASDQRTLTGLEQKQYIQSFENRRKFNPLALELPEEGVSFEVYCLWRNMKCAEYEGHTLDQVYQEHMFRFEHELVFSQVRVNEWHLKYCLFQPVTSSVCFRFQGSYFGGKTDYLPLIHPIRFPQTLSLDYKNHLGNGHDKLYMTTMQHTYYLYTGLTISSFLEKHNSDVENNILQVYDSGEISTFLNLETIYKKFITQNKNNTSDEERTGDTSHVDYPGTSCNISQGMIIAAQSKFELLNSEVLAADAASRLFFVIKIQVKALPNITKHGYKHTISKVFINITQPNGMQHSEGNDENITTQKISEEMNDVILTANVSQMGSKVEGYVEYKYFKPNDKGYEAQKNKDQENESDDCNVADEYESLSFKETVKIMPFVLDIEKGQKIVKNVLNQEV